METDGSAPANFPKAAITKNPAPAICRIHKTMRTSVPSLSSMPPTLGTPRGWRNRATCPAGVYLDAPW
ncbi:hypothetical protein GCM10023334_080560 [Nonomuraea thailandensis]